MQPPSVPPASSPTPRAQADRNLSLADLTRLLQASQLITAEMAKNLMARPAAAKDDRHPLEWMAEYALPDPRKPGSLLSLEVLTAWLADVSGLSYFRIDPLSMDVDSITRVLPYAYAARLRILPVKVSRDEITIACCEPWVRQWTAELAQTLPQKITRVVANPQDIRRYLVEFYALARSVKASSHEQGQLPRSSVQNLEQLIDLGRRGQLAADDSHIVSIVDWLLNYAFDCRASDIHLEPRRERGNVRFRIDGQLHEVYQLPAPVMTAVTSRIKILSRMDVAEKRKPQDGRIKTRSPEGREVELRVASLPTAFGEKLVMRIFDPEVLVRDFSELGFDAQEAALWREMIGHAHGIILVTGPTGSGKTTTLYSTLKQLAVPAVNVCTIEDPIELVEPSFNQMQVQAGIDLSFAAGVRAMLRQDPDIIMIGEIRDLETAEIAIQAALTGHLVLSTLHTNDAPSAVTRLLDLGVPAYLIKATVIGVVAQRLLRLLCPHCKQAVAGDDDRWTDLTRSAPLPAPVLRYEAAGCLECRETGFLGRKGVYEIMPLSAALKGLLRGDCELDGLRAQARQEGMTPLRIAGARKVADGLTTVDEVLRCTPDPQES